MPPREFLHYRSASLEGVKLPKLLVFGNNALSVKSNACNKSAQR
jgi:hypothetical protein